MIKYALRESHLGESSTQKKYLAQVVEHQSYSMEKIVQLMAKRGTTVTETDINAVMNVYRDVIVDLIQEGIGIEHEVFSANYSISGTFDSEDDIFDHKRHHIKCNIHPTSLIRERLTKIETHKVKANNSDPYITLVIDSKSGQENTIATPDEFIKIKGSNLKFDNSDPKQGVFFIIPNVTTVRIEQVESTTDSLAHVRLPKDIEQGEYLVEIRTMLNASGRPSKILKVGQFHLPIQVV
ncbi:MAG: DNA-binding domain-containing protein [Treponemataceae bacterium]